jgi:hypothetical protein
MRYYGSSINRTLCSVLDEMRQCVETLNFGNMLNLLEESDEYFSRMLEGLHKRSIETKE